MHRHLLSIACACTLAALAAAACSDDDTAVPPPPPPVPGRCVPPPRSTDAIVKLAPAFAGQRFTSPTELIQGPGKRFYVLEQRGIVRVFDAAGAPATTALDIVSNVVSGGEAGLLGIAFDPKFADNGLVYLDFTSPLAQPRPGVVFETVIARYHSNDGGVTFDPASEKRILVVDQPFANHNGGHLAFGPDGFLYISLGDGGSGGDPFGNGQNKDALLGKLLRIDPSRDPYGIPPTNPFAGGGGRAEVFAYGLRNTWKFSFDQVTGELWGADVGQGKFEEVDRIVVGGNYGWNVREGMHCYGAATCASDGFIDPVVEYDHSQGVSITGGYVYRGTKVPALTGKFVYGDFGSGHIWAVDQTGPSSFAPLSLLETTNVQISTFGQDVDGEIYVVDYASGTVQQLVAADLPTTPTGFGATLAETGCVDAKDTTKPPPGLIGYTVNSPLWSDGATKDRWLYVPAGAAIGVSPDGDFDVPPGSVAVKTFSAFGKKIETRLFVRYEDATWAGYSYEWNDAQTDATLLTEGKTKPLANGASWTFPSRAQCFACHTAAAGFTLGLEARQLDRDDDGKNQLERFTSVLDHPVVPGVLAPLRAADTAGASDEERARGYLHSNCSTCHREGSGSGAATMDLRIDKPFAATKTCNVTPQGGDLGVAGAKILTPGDPSRSTLALRMRALDQNRMPPLATHVVDETGVTAVEAWIRALPASCP